MPFAYGLAGEKDCLMLRRCSLHTHVGCAEILICKEPVVSTADQREILDCWFAIECEWMNVMHLQHPALAAT